MNTPKTHQLNVSYLVVGLVFLGIAGSWALRSSGVVDSHDSRWMLPAVLVAAGVIGLVAFASKGVSRSRGTRSPEHDGADGWTSTQDDQQTQQFTEQDTDVEGDPR